MLFPEEDVDRKYDIQEVRMTQLLAQCFGIGGKAFEKWSLEEASGCLGQELRVVLERFCPHPDGFISPLSLAEVDKLLDELASKSAYSHHSIRSKYPIPCRRPRAAIISALFRHLSPEDASVLTQVILKDLRPLLYPLTEFHYTTALIKFNTASVRMLTKEHAMNTWDPSKRMSKFYRLRASLTDAAAFAEQSSGAWHDISPSINLPVAIPKSEKAQGCDHALGFLEGSEKVWAETKYDGERAQIHVEIKDDNSSHITIFSKSRRDSTQDRHAVHHIIRRALRLDSSTPSRENDLPIVRKNVILDAEMVAFKGDRIDEFWHIRELIETTANGIRGNGRHSNFPITYDEANERYSLGLVFFDVIYLDSVSLYYRPYVYPGKAKLASRYLIDMTKSQPDMTLQQIFADHIASHQEGLVLKAEDSFYNDYRRPWVKLKRDYIPGYGDTLDLVILGASWEKIRGRSLRVPPTTFTTFYIGALKNGLYMNDDICPKFHMYFTASYGLTREKLEEVNFLIKNSDPIPYSLQHYELRFPRIEKVYRPSERNWKCTASLEELHKLACSSIGRDRSDKDIKDWANALWGQQISPSIHSPRKRKARAYLWNAKLSLLGSKSNQRPMLASYDALSSEKRPREPGTYAKLLTPKTNFSQPQTSRTQYSDALLASNGTQHANLLLTPPFDQSSGHPKSSGAVALTRDDSYELSWTSTLAWFSSPGTKCPSCRLWRKKIPREGRLHSLESLLVGCGRTAEKAVQKPGVIIIDESDENAGKWRNKVINILRLHGSRVSITVLGCQSSR
ncbi:hypothetical protein CPB84DRAFT_1766114 [Gymnopilus junonius]|uniref:ATP-dependent DNA ligase family profile domain-containing protein n=1 Tax=Gymnopilus junonius TaxID=109634 RepID=A0A9P5NWX6_GYMJU|nr:hypothetical protein CPB84DRAFT_1766114 [Gymnopilus junonius]